MIWRTPWFLLLLLGIGAAGDEIPAPDLAREIEKKIGQAVTFTDEIVHKTRQQELKGYVKFETIHLRCIVAEDKKEAIEMLDAILKGSSPRSATIQGTPTKVKDLQTFVEVQSIERPKFKRPGKK